MLHNRRQVRQLIREELGRALRESEYDDDMAIEDLNKAIKMGSEEAKELLAEYFSEGDV